MVHENVIGDEQLVTSQPCPQAVVVIIVVPQPEDRVETSELVSKLPFDHHQETDQFSCDPECPGICGMPLLGPLVESGFSITAVTDQLRAEDIIGAGADNSDAVIEGECRHHPACPVWSDQHIVVHDHQISAP